MKQYYILFALPFLFACGNTKPSDPNNTSTASEVKNLSFSVVATYPHDTSSYTQGLIVYNGNLYEGTGNYGHSKLKQVDLSTGKSIREISLSSNYFGEGITILRDTVYQLTWKEGKVFVYSLKDFKKIKEFNVPIEGWGLTNNGQELVVTTGSGDIYFYEPATFKLLKTQTLTEAGTPSFNLNESEWIDDSIYINQYSYPYILKANPTTGEIVGKIDLTSIWEHIRQLNPNADVPNGIAYDTNTKKIYITGKWWPELYEIQIAQ